MTIKVALLQEEWRKWTVVVREALSRVYGEGDRQKGFSEWIERKTRGSLYVDGESTMKNGNNLTKI